MDYLDVFTEILNSSIKTIVLITSIIIPMMIVIELMKATQVLDKAASIFHPAMKFVFLPKEGAFPLLAGFLFGISYGSGLIISFSKSGNLNKKDLMFICIFLAVCHGIIEDPLIFAAIGAAWWFIVVIRISLAVIILVVISRILDVKNQQTLIN